MGHQGQGWIVLHQNIVDLFHDDQHVDLMTLHGVQDGVDWTGHVVKRDLQFFLAHELDHSHGFGDHLDPDGQITPNAEQCGGT